MNGCTHISDARPNDQRSRCKVPGTMGALVSALWLAFRWPRLCLLNTQAVSHLRGCCSVEQHSDQMAATWKVYLQGEQNHSQLSAAKCLQTISTLTTEVVGWPIKHEQKQVARNIARNWTRQAWTTNWPTNDHRCLGYTCDQSADSRYIYKSNNGNKRGSVPETFACPKRLVNRRTRWGVATAMVNTHINSVCEYGDRSSTIVPDMKFSSRNLAAQQLNMVFSTAAQYGIQHSSPIWYSLWLFEVVDSRAAARGWSSKGLE